MANDYYNHGGYPSTNAPGDSSSLRTELSAIAAGFAKLPGLLGANNEVVHVNGTGTGLSSSPFATLLSAIAAVALSGTLSVSGAATLSSTLSVGGAATFASTLGVTGNATVGGTLGVTGDFTGHQASLIYTSGIGLQLTRNGSSINTVIGYTNESGSVFAGHGSANAFQVAGTSNLGSSPWMTVTSSTLTVAGQFLAPTSDSAALPGHAWSGDPDTGMWRAAADAIGFTVGGASVWHILASGALATASSPPTFGTIGRLSIAGTTATFASSIVNSRFSDDAAGPTIRFGKSRGGSVGTYTACQNNDVLGELDWYGADGVDGATIVARIRSTATENYTVSNHGAQLEFATLNAGGGGAFTTRLTLGDGGATVAGGLSVSSGITVSGAATIGSTVRALGATQGLLGVLDGAASGASANSNVNSLVIDGSGNSGITLLGGAASVHQIRFGRTGVGNNVIGGFSYAHATDTLALVAAGSTVLSLNNGGASVTGHTDTSGSFRVDGVQVVTNRRAGWAAATGTATRTTFATTTVTVAQLAERVKALLDDLIGHGLIGA